MRFSGLLLVRDRPGRPGAVRDGHLGYAIRGERHPEPRWWRGSERTVTAYAGPCGPVRSEPLSQRFFAVTFRNLTVTYCWSERCRLSSPTPCRVGFSEVSHSTPDAMEPALARTALDIAIFSDPSSPAHGRRCGASTGRPVAGVARVPRCRCSRQAGDRDLTIFGYSGFTEPGGAMNMQLGAGLTVAWLLAFAIWAGLHERRGEPT